MLFISGIKSKNIHLPSSLSSNDQGLQCVFPALSEFPCLAGLACLLRALCQLGARRLPTSTCSPFFYSRVNITSALRRAFAAWQENTRPDNGCYVTHQANRRDTACLPFAPIIFLLLPIICTMVNSVNCTE